MFQYFENLNLFLALCEQRKPTAAECMNARSDLLALQSLILRLKEQNKIKLCEHKKINGDNYGVTCIECGEVLEGFGYWAEGSKECKKHLWLDDGSSFICMYCETRRPSDPNWEA